MVTTEKNAGGLAGTPDKRQMHGLWLFQQIAAIALCATPFLLLLMYLAPSATMLGIGIGNIYDLFSAEGEMHGSAIALVVETCVAAVLTVPLIVGVFDRYYRPVVPPMIMLAGLLALTQLITSAVLVSQIADLDGGLGLVGIGASPILALVFSSLAIVLGSLYTVLYYLPSTDREALNPCLTRDAQHPLKLGVFLSMIAKGFTEQSKRAKLLSFVTAAVSVTFAVCMFLFPLAPVCTTFGMSNFTFYELFGLEKLAVYTDCAIFILVFACFFAVFAVPMLICTLMGNRKPIAALTGLCMMISLALLILASVVLGQVAKDGGGMGLMQAGAAPILILIFSILVFLYCGGSLIFSAITQRKTK